MGHFSSNSLPWDPLPYLMITWQVPPQLDLGKSDCFKKCGTSVKRCSFQQYYSCSIPKIWCKQTKKQDLDMNSGDFFLHSTLFFYGNTQTICLMNVNQIRNHKTAEMFFLCKSTELLASSSWRRFRRKSFRCCSLPQVNLVAKLMLQFKCCPYMDVSENSGIPKSSILIVFSSINHPFWGYPYFWKHPHHIPSHPATSGPPLISRLTLWHFSVLAASLVSHLVATGFVHCWLVHRSVLWHWDRIW